MLLNERTHNKMSSANQLVASLSGEIEFLLREGRTDYPLPRTHWKLGLQFLRQIVADQCELQNRLLLNGICAPLLLDVSDRVPEDLKIAALHLVLEVLFAKEDIRQECEELFLGVVKSALLSKSDEDKSSTQWSLLRTLLKSYPATREKFSPECNAEVVKNLETMLSAFYSTAFDAYRADPNLLGAISLLSRLLPDSQIVADCITQTVNKDQGNISRKLYLLCSLTDALLTPRNASALLDDSLCKVVAFGLASADNQVRKWSLYLLQRMIDGLLRGDFAPHPQCRLLLAAKSTFKVQRRLWDDIFLIISTIDEKQVHIVKQITTKMTNLVNFVSDVVDKDRPVQCSWLLVICTIMLNHQNQAVSKWSLTFFLQSFKRDRFTVGAETMSSFIAGPVLDALNNSKAYSRDSDPTLEEYLKVFLTSWTKDAPGDEAATFWGTMLQSVFQKSWGPIPLYYVCQTISHLMIEQDAVVPKETVDSLGYFVAHAMHCQEPLLKCGAQCRLLEMVLKCSNARDYSSDVLEAGRFLLKFHGQKKIFIYGTGLWQLAVAWLLRGFDITITNEELWLKLFQSCPEEEEGRRAFAMTIALAAENESALQCSSFFQGTLREIEESHCRLYNENICRNLLLLCDLLDIYSPPKKREGRSHLTYGSSISREVIFLKTEAKIVEAAICCLERHSLELESYRRILRLALHVDGHEAPLRSFAEESALALKQGEMAELVRKGVVVQAFAKDPRFVNLISECIIQDNYATALEKLVRAKELFSAGQLRKHDLCLHSSNEWDVLSRILGRPSNCIQLPLGAFSSLLEKASESLTLGGGLVLCSVQRGIQSAVRNVILNSPAEEAEQSLSQIAEELCEFFSASCAATFELRRTELFWPTISALVEMVLSNELMMMGTCNRAIRATQSEIIKKLLDESELVTGVAPIVAIRLYRASLETNTFPLCALPCLGKLLAFGPMYRKDQKLVMDVNRSLVEAGDDLTANLIEGSDHGCDSLVRAYTIHILLFFGEMIPQEEVVNEMKNFDDLVTCGSNRHFDNSIIHLTKHRLLQSLLILTPVLSEEISDTIVQRLLKSIIEDTLQLSVRRLSEWVLIILFSRHKTTRRLHDCYEEVSRSTTHLSSVPSFLVVYYFLARVKATKGDYSLLHSTMEKIAPWCMSQYFSTRICAQVCLRKLYLRGKELGACEVEQYSFLVSCVDQCIRQGDGAKNQAKIEEDFFLTLFDPEDCFSMKDIFFELPRLCGLQQEEWANFETFELLHSLSEGKKIPALSNSASRLGIAGTPRPRQTGPQQLSNETIEEEAAAIQRKITPWKPMFGDTESEVASAVFPNLVLVASLIDRLPNLGGLARTCEIFGVGEYVMAKKSYTEEKEFRSLSMTAQNWLPISEVPPGEISAFLSSKREDGFTIVAVEQTSNSKCLTEYNFPDKTVLLLGNETEGIPVELIQEVDVCVEIPQKGLIRSFNVHVTGALVLWEYVRQKSLHDKKGGHQVVPSSSISAQDCLPRHDN